MLEVVQEVGLAGTSRRRGRKQLAAESLLLRAAPLREVHQHGIEEQRIDVALFPAHVEVGWVFLGGYEASVDVRATASGIPQRIERTLEAGEQALSMGSGSVASFKLLPCGLVDPGGKVSGFFKRREHNTILVLGRDGAYRVKHFVQRAAAD